MATGSVSVDDLERGALPAVCAKTGEQADVLVPMDFYVGPNWTWAFFFAGAIPFLVALLFMRRDKVSGFVPLSRRYRDRLRVLTRGGVAAMVTALLFAFAAAAWGPPQLVWVAVVLFVAGMGGLMAGGQPVGGRVDVVHGRVDLTRLHPGFVAALATPGTHRR